MKYWIFKCENDGGLIDYLPEGLKDTFHQYSNDLWHMVSSAQSVDDESFSVDSLEIY